MKKKPFAWFDLTRLFEDPTYPSQLASELRYSDSAKLAEALNGCTDILLVERDDFKNYKNKRNRHITQEVLRDLPSQSNKISNLCRAYSIEWCANYPEFDLNFIKFPFEIDSLDLLSLHVLNLIDEAFSKVGDGDSNNPDALVCLLQALICWHRLLEKNANLTYSKNIAAVELRLEKKLNKNKQMAAGLYTAAGNRMRSVHDDLRIAFILLFLLNDESNKKKSWRSLNEFVDGIDQAINDGLKYVPLKAQKSDLNNVSDIRLKEVIKEINHFDKALLSSFVNKPIPDIKAENSRWLHYKIVKEWQPEFNFTYLAMETEEM